LLVDDDEMIREFIGDSLERAQFKVVTAKSATRPCGSTVFRETTSIWS